ncbi:PAS domain-containing sensor histidine kinase [Adhaeribacter radiodurans]|uniref:histidine kinase n=1 Tax=Adhaeribacter radiodurans TaxID=2745197 RepID=A0A7L7L6F9_9BACT|nr:sensor histidine kinase [Adhaeribacter radiodurans]QMU28363.1 sensor histidine kinase [Adhaeribacter radiodurans]
MLATIFDQWSQSSKKVLFLFNMATGHFDYLSPSLTTLWGIKREQVLHDPKQLITAIDQDDQEAVTLRYEKVRQGISIEIEFNISLPENQQKQVKVEAQPILDDNHVITHLMGQAEDVTLQAQYREYLMEFSRKKNNTLHIVAHDLQGPLAIMKSVASLLDADHAEHRYEELTNYTQIINKAYHDCTQLIHEVLLDEHIHSVSTPVRRNRFDVVNKVRQTASTFIKSQVVKIPIHIESPEEKIMVELDEVKFTQIINNLITNSIKYTPPKGEITISLVSEGANLLLTHADTGIGIPVELQPYLFDKYNSKARRLGLNGEKSNGIGLSIIKDLVELQGGKIEVKSEENQGTTFYLTFPLLT